MAYKKELIYIGWREWVSFPKLKIPAIKAKIDTGARTSSIHTFRLETYSEKGVSMVRFGVHPLQQRTDIEIFCSAQIVDERLVTDSGGHREKRYVIMTPIKVGDKEWPVEVTLAKRDNMQFRMLLGRTAMAKKLIVDPHASYRVGEDLADEYPALIKKTPKKQIEKKIKKKKGNK